MRFVEAEIYRTSAAAREGILQEDLDYFLTLGDQDPTKVRPGLTYAKYRELLRALDYDAADDAASQGALKEIDTVLGRTLRTEQFDWVAANYGDRETPIQLDLVLNPAELSGLPFEIATHTGRHLFQCEPPVIITRRLRGRFRGKRRPWPHEPRILFAWASPEGAGASVPHRPHFEALIEALQPWVEPLEGVPGVGDYRKVLTVLENATLADIAAACEAKKDYTHVHLLAHGSTFLEEKDDHFTKRFGLALEPDGTGAPPANDKPAYQTATPEQLTDALAPVRDTCVVVTLAACYGGSQSNPLIPEGSLAHTLHKSGVPIVIASQWPLTFDGSESVARTFYRGVLTGRDARLVTHDCRKTLYRCQEKCKADWASLAAYVSLPEGYEDYLVELKLKARLASLETTSKWAESLKPEENPKVSLFEKVESRFFEREADLLETLDELDTQHPLVLENLGLLGSAHKRLAELYFNWSQLDDQKEVAERMTASLEKARGYYKQGFDLDINDHWLATQTCSLEAVVAGSLSDPLDWEIAMRAANRASDRKDYWAFGSLAELILLGACAGNPRELADAEAALRSMQENAPGPRELAQAVNSTRRQLVRYVEWWTRKNGFFCQAEDLVESAKILVAVLDEA